MRTERYRVASTKVPTQVDQGRGPEVEREAQRRKLCSATYSGRSYQEIQIFDAQLLFGRQLLIQGHIDESKKVFQKLKAAPIAPEVR